MHSKLKTLFSYIVPAAGGLFVTYLYNVVDGIFVGQGVGAAALGAVNVAVPFLTFVVAIAAMFPMGAATITAAAMGCKDYALANRAFMLAVWMTFGVSVLLMLAGMIFAKEIVDLSGAASLSVEMRTMASDYLFCYSAFSIPMLMSTCLSVFVRNDGSPALAFLGMCAGAAANVFLDWLFIFPFGWGVIGAAGASGLGQIFSLLVLLPHFLKKKGQLRFEKVKVSLNLGARICRQGLAEAVSQLSTPITALCYNLVLSRMIGDLGVSTFSVLSFLYSQANAILSGVAQGLQPLWGMSYGKNEPKEIAWLFRAGILINLVLSIGITAILWGFPRLAIEIFNGEPSLVEFVSGVLPIFAAAFVPMALNLGHGAGILGHSMTEMKATGA